jgi:hypothetical protein
MGASTRPPLKWEDNIEMNLTQTRWEAVVPLAWLTAGNTGCLCNVWVLQEWSWGTVTFWSKTAPWYQPASCVIMLSNGTSFLTFDLYCTAINQRSFLQGRMQFLLSKLTALCEALWWGGHSFILSVFIAVFCKSSFYMKGTSNTEGWIRPALDMGYQRRTKQWNISVWSGILNEMNMKNITDFWYMVPCNLKEICTCRVTRRHVPKFLNLVATELFFFNFSTCCT